MGAMLDKKTVRSLDTKWKEFIFAFSGFGPNLLMVLMGAYFTDAINPSALAFTGEFQMFASKACYILPAVFPILYAISKAFDGIIDVPFAHITDTLSTKWGRRRPAIAICFLPMVISYICCWIPVGGVDGQLINTIWIVFWSLVFFSTYTMCLIAFYGSLSTVCENEPQRLRVSAYKSFFDTISYCLVYALVPVILSGLKVHIDKFVLIISVPLMLTMLIPLFMIKEGAKYGYPEDNGEAPQKVTFKESISLTFKNKTFANWLVVNCCTFFGLQMFLVSMNSLILGGMGLGEVDMTILNTCAFAPVPIMLFLFNKLKSKKGIRFAYQTCLLSFAVAILSFFFGSRLIVGDNRMLKLIIGCIGGVCGSWAIGSFFMMPYLITAQISAIEEQLLKKNHSAMYFAANALFTSIVGAISGSLVYEVIKNIFFCPSTRQIAWVKGEMVGEQAVKAIYMAAEKFGFGNALALQNAEAVLPVYNLGTTLVPFIVAVTCILGFVLAFRMPRDYTPALVGRELKRQYPDLDISSVEKDEEFSKNDKGEVVFVQIGLSILSGFIFGFIWPIFMLKEIKKLAQDKVKPMLWWALSCFIPFISIYYLIKADNVVTEKINVAGGKAKSSKVWFIILGIIFPILPLNIVSLAILQSKLNKVYKLEETAE